MKKETIEYAAEKCRVFYLQNNMTINQIFEAGAQWQADRMYSEQDMAESFIACWKANVPEGIECKLSFKEWFEQLKKK